MQPTNKKTFRWRRPMQAFMHLCLVFLCTLGVGDGFLALPRLFLPRYSHSYDVPILDLRLHYSSEPSGLESSIPSNATATIARNGKTSKVSCGGDDLLNGDEVATLESVPLVDAVDNETWTRNVYDYEKAAAGTLGDIMARGNEATSTATAATGANLSEAVAQRDGLVTNAISSGTLANRFGIDHPLDRMALTANGNLQRLVSSYYDAPVEVIVDYCLPLIKADRDNEIKTTSRIRNGNTSPPKRWDRLVRLRVHNQTFCRAHSIITVYDPLCQKLVESGEVGLGQLFRYLDILPEFELHNAGPYPRETGGGFWREYTLKCKELSCDIHEDFRANTWDLHPSVNGAR